MIRFDLGPLLQGQMRRGKFKVGWRGDFHCRKRPSPTLQIFVPKAHGH